MLTSYVSPTVYLKLIATTIFWGATWVVAHILVEEVPPFTASFVRFAIAVAALAWFVWDKEGRFPPLTRHQMGTVFWLGFIGVFLYNYFFLTAMQHITAGRGALVIALNPVLTALVAWLWFKEGITARKLLGIVVALSGCLLVISKGRFEEILNGGLGIGELLAIGCVVTWAFYTFIGRYATRTLSPLVATFYACLVGCVMLGVASISEAPWTLVGHFSTKAWFSLLFLGFFATALGGTWFTDAVKEIGATRTAPFINLTPISGVLLGALVLEERLDRVVLIGGALTIFGVMLTVYQKKQKR